MGTIAHVSRWGNSLGLRLPKAVTLEAQLVDGDTVEISVDNGAIVVRPSRPRYSLDELVRRITPRNRHGESDWAGPLGAEVKSLDWSARRVELAQSAPVDVLTDVREKLRVLLGL
jgi:antitoxin MazE